jgi:hypothetical protein
MLIDIQLPSYALTRYESNRSNSYHDLGLDVSGKPSGDIPRYIRQSLTYKEVGDQIELAHEKSRKYVVWKYGRTPHITYGFLSYIKSSHRNGNGLVTEEQVVVDCRKYGSRDSFSEEGSSGSLVFDSDGDACAILWGATPESPFAYVTPIEYVLEDIREKCNAKEVTLVVRDEDRADVAS